MTHRRRLRHLGRRKSECRNPNAECQNPKVDGRRSQLWRWSLAIFRGAPSRKDGMTRPSVAPANPEGIVSLSPARGALPWEKRVVSAKPNGVVARWRSGDTTLGLKIARTPTLGSLADSVAGLEDTISLGLQNHPSFRRSARQWPRTEYPKGIGSNPSGIGPGGLPHAVPQRIAGWGQRDSDLQYCYLSDPEGRERRLKPALDDRGARSLWAGGAV